MRHKTASEQELVTRAVRAYFIASQREGCDSPPQPSSSSAVTEMGPDPALQFIPFPAEDWDTWQPRLTPECWSLFCAVVRKTAGWDKTSDIISGSQLEKMTGMKERRIQRNMRKLVKSGAPVRVVSTGKQGTRFSYGSIEPVTGAGLNHQPVGQSVTGDGLESSPSPVTPTTDVESLNRESLRTLSSKSQPEPGMQETAALGEEGLVVKTNAEKGDPAPVILQGPPTSKHLFVNLKTGKTWEAGQDVACLQYELKIPMGEAEALLGCGLDVGTILATARDSWEFLSKANSRTANLRGILKNVVSKGKANKPAEPTRSTPSPVPPPSFPCEKQAPAAHTAAAKPSDAIDAKILASMAAGKSGYVPIAAAIGSDSETVECRQRAMLADGRLVKIRDAEGCMVTRLPMAVARAKVMPKFKRRPDESLDAYWTRKAKAEARRPSWQGGLY